MCPVCPCPVPVPDFVPKPSGFPFVWMLSRNQWLFICPGENVSRMSLFRSCPGCCPGVCPGTSWFSICPDENVSRMSHVSGFCPFREPAGFIYICPGENMFRVSWNQISFTFVPVGIYPDENMSRMSLSRSCPACCPGTRWLPICPDENLSRMSHVFGFCPVREPGEHLSR